MRCRVTFESAIGSRMKAALDIAGILTRALLVLVMLSSTGLQASAMVAPSVDTRVSEMSVSEHSAAGGHHGDHAGHTSSAAKQTHDHPDTGGSDCSIHCMTALPETSVARTATRIVRQVAYSVVIEDRAGRAVPALERPPRT